MAHTGRAGAGRAGAGRVLAHMTHGQRGPAASARRPGGPAARRPGGQRPGAAGPAALRPGSAEAGWQGRAVRATATERQQTIFIFMV